MNQQKEECLFFLLFEFFLDDRNTVIEPIGIPFWLFKPRIQQLLDLLFN